MNTCASCSFLVDLVCPSGALPVASERQVGVRLDLWQGRKTGPGGLGLEEGRKGAGVGTGKT